MNDEEGNVRMHYILICHHSLVTLFLGTAFESTITIIIKRKYESHEKRIKLPITKNGNVVGSCDY